MWCQVFPPDGKIPVNPVLIKGVIQGQPDQYFLIDFTRVSPAQKEELIKVLSTRFDIPPVEIRKDIEEHGAPVTADGVVVTICALHIICCL